MTDFQKSAAIWGVAALVFSIFVLAVNNSPMVLGAGFFAKFFALIVAFFGGWAGALIGDAIRRFAMPEGFFTNGGMGSIIKTKVFWAIGPQCIGMALGSFFGFAIVLG